MWAHQTQVSASVGGQITGLCVPLPGQITGLCVPVSEARSLVPVSWTDSHIDHAIAVCIARKWRADAPKQWETSTGQTKHENRPNPLGQCENENCFPPQIWISNITLVLQLFPKHSLVVVWSLKGSSGLGSIDSVLRQFWQEMQCVSATSAMLGNLSDLPQSPCNVSLNSVHLPAGPTWKKIRLKFQHPCASAPFCFLFLSSWTKNTAPPRVLKSLYIQISMKKEPGLGNSELGRIWAHFLCWQWPTATQCAWQWVFAKTGPSGVGTGPVHFSFVSVLVELM